MLWFTAFVVAALTLGIGANAAMFGIVDRLLLSGPPHIQDPDRVVRLYLTAQPTACGVHDVGVWPRELRPRADNAKSFDRVGELRRQHRRGRRRRRGARGARRLRVRHAVSAARREPLVGRFFNEDENRPDQASHVAVLGYAAWQRWFGGAAT